MLAPQVGLDHLRIAHHLGRRPVGDDTAVVDDDHPVDDRHQLLELVFDHQHRGTFGMQPAEAAALVQAADRLGEQLRLGRVQAAARLVEQQQLGLGGDRARHLEPLEIALRQRGGRLERHVRDADELERVHRLCLDALYPFAAAARARRHQRHHHVGDDRQVAEGPHVLERAGDAALDHLPWPQGGDVRAAEHDAARIGLEDFRDQPLEKDEFTLFCQPILALTGAERYPMAEILVRLREEERALLPPGEFLPVFEHYRLMPQLDRWVVRTTVKRLARGSRIPRFTVNLSGQTLEDADFPRFVAGQLASNHVVAGALLFEIDESDTLARLDAPARFANAYRAVGGKPMIDGVGRRPGAFRALAAVRAEYVKVDGAITRKLLTSEGAKAKMNALLRVGEALGFAMVAEFVEDQAVLLRLKALGVGYAQGFGIYQPHPVDSFAAEPAR